MVLDNWRKQAHLFCTNNKSLGSRAPPMNIPFNGLFKLAFGLSQSLDQWVMFINTRSIPKNAHIPLNRRSSKPSFYIQPTAFFSFRPWLKLCWYFIFLYAKCTPNSDARWMYRSQQDCVSHSPVGNDANCHGAILLACTRHQNCAVAAMRHMQPLLLLFMHSR